MRKGSFHFHSLTLHRLVCDLARVVCDAVIRAAGDFARPALVFSCFAIIAATVIALAVPLAAGSLASSVGLTLAVHDALGATKTGKLGSSIGNGGGCETTATARS